MKDVIDKWAARPFDYHGNDCCQFVGECLEVQLGYNPARSFRYDGKKGADNILEHFGGIGGLFRHLFGAPYFGYRDGYVATVQNDGNLVAGIFYRGRIIARVEKGLMDLPPGRALEVFRCHS